MITRSIAVMLIGLMVGSVLLAAGGGRQTTPREDHIAWVAEALKRIQTITPGMTRKELLLVMTTEGGLSTRLRRTFVSRDCPYFKVDVEFEAVGPPSRDSSGRVTLLEGDQDRIVKISRPYLQFSVAN
jgi:hypothetical protein